MLRDSLPPYQLPKSHDLSVPDNHEVEHILLFIDKKVPEFPDYYKTIKDSDRENRISDFLVNHLQLCKIENNQDYFPYDFRKNPTQESSGKETDIGVFVLTRDRKPSPIIEFEAKRFSENSSNEQYVYGDRGGIERFKRGHHSSHLKVCGMFAYVQNRTIEEWFLKVNGWLTKQFNTNTDNTIDWLENEQLSKYASLSTVEKYWSSHTRKTLKDEISLWHYFINLTT
ncbi:hypothetical protein SAMN05421856_101328 [Chryseobacterium taichungense]|uniref:Uncharacterized protein n=1 Tax=Chryseobacterium taichungense TaxID=295069 RepID=A0A1H7VYA3_9FLAO|nr:hypothetical protein [Chryseobacterium taichungense]SEM13768.1 hypothetical protein SAMN05421856_101328 [Chryseobacterium taichungense]